MKLQDDVVMASAPSSLTAGEKEGAVAAGVAVVVMAALTVVLGVFAGPKPAPPPVYVPPKAVAAARLPVAPPPPAPQALQNELTRIAERFDQPVGMAVMDVGSGWVASVDGGGVYPQQSVSKLWVAISVLDAVDQGRLRLDQQVVMQDRDRSVFFQPLTALIRKEGYPLSIHDLLGHALSESDNSANDKLLSLVGGADGVLKVLQRKGLAGLKVGAPEHELQSAIAGLTWDPAYGRGRVFEEVRSHLPTSVRDAALKAYLDDPADGVSPASIAKALAALKRGEVLSPGSTAVMLDLMAKARTGPRRLKGGLPHGWAIAHKTGTGPDWRGASVGINDVAVITAPDGHDYAVAVMIRRTSKGVPARLEMMQQVSRAVVQAWRSDPGHELRRG
jgi:beta-lactamase class A